MGLFKIMAILASRASVAIIVSLFVLKPILAEPWVEHQKTLSNTEREIFKHQQELEVLVEKKKGTHDRYRIEETLQRIVDIHTELITLRKIMDTERAHIKSMHPEKAALLENIQFDPKAKGNPKNKFSPISAELDELLLKVQLKYASFQLPEEKKAELVQVEKIVELKEKKKKEREADVYLRKRSRVRLEK